MSVLGLIVALAGAFYIGWGVGRTTEWCKVLNYLRAQGVDDWVTIGITADEHRDPPSEWTKRPIGNGPSGVVE